MEAAKRKTSWLSLLVLACVISTPIFASSADVLHLKTRAELSAENGQFSIEPSTLNPVNATRYYDWFGEVASDSSVAPRSVGEFKLTDTVANHLDDVVKRGPFKGEPARPFLNSPLTIREIMAGGKGVPDPGGFPGALRWDVPGTFRGSSGTWELVVDPKTNTILHFNFVGGG